MWIIALLLLMSPQVVSDSGPCNRASVTEPAEPPRLIVQVVDPSWVPLGGAETTVYWTRNRKKVSQVAHTMDDGDAKFWIPGEEMRIIRLKRIMEDSRPSV
jgi:hypothetical protein